MENSEIFSILAKSQRHVLATLKENDDIVNEPFEFNVSNFTKMGLPAINTIGDLIKYIDPHGEICEGRGFREYVEQIKNSVSDRKLEHESFLLPLSYHSVKLVVLFEIFHYSKSKSYLLFFSRLDGDSALIDISNAISSSFKDDLTGLFNLNTAYDHIYRRTSSMYFCLFDLNKFKAINDKYGHAVGDDVLTDIAESLIKISTSNEMFYRRSGDEFMVFMKPDSYEYAMKIIDNISMDMKKMRESKYSFFKNEDISASFGLVHIPIDKLPSDFFKKRYMDVVKLADYAMYNAKLNHLKCYFLPEEKELSLLRENKLDEEINELASKISR